MKKLKNILQKADLGMSIFIVVGIVIVINFFSYQFFLRLDLTENKDYTISEASKKSLKELDDIVNIKVYFSKYLPSELTNLPQDVEDILEEYNVYSNGNVRYEFVDPDSLENPDRELAMMGIPIIQFNIIEKDKKQLVKGFLGISIQHGDRSEVLPVVEYTNNLEYQLTMAIKKVATEDMPVVGILTSNKTLNIDKEIGVAYQELKRLYDVQSVDLSSEDSEIASDINTLIILGPKEEFSEEQMKKIDNFLISGKSLLVLLDGIDVADGLIPSENISNLHNFLENYGVRVNKNLVLDSSAGRAQFSAGFFTFSSSYPLWPKVEPEGFDKNNAAVAKLETLLLPWVSSLDVIDEKISDENKISYLVKSTYESWIQDGKANLDPQQQFVPTGDQGEKNLAVSVFGKFRSAYGDQETDSGRLIVVGDSDFMTDGFLRQSADNLTFFQNIVDSLSLDEDLINIRSKGVTSRPIKKMDSTMIALIRYFNIFGMTILVVIFGMLRYFLRRRGKFADDL